MARLNKFSAIADVMLVMEELGSPFTGKEFCITGHLGRKRSDIEEIIRLAGGRTVERPGYRVTVITNADWNGLAAGTKVSSKYEAAKKHRCEIINEETFFKRLSEGITASAEEK